MPASPCAVLARPASEHAEFLAVARDALGVRRGRQDRLLQARSRRPLVRRRARHRRRLLFTASCKSPSSRLTRTGQNYFTSIIAAVRKHDDYTISVEGFVPKPPTRCCTSCRCAVAAAFSQARRRLGHRTTTGASSRPRARTRSLVSRRAAHRAQARRELVGRRAQVQQEPLQRRHDPARRHPRRQCRLRVLSARRARPVPVRDEPRVGTTRRAARSSTRATRAIFSSTTTYRARAASGSISTTLSLPTRTFGYGLAHSLNIDRGSAPSFAATIRDCTALGRAPIGATRIRPSKRCRSTSPKPTRYFDAAGWTQRGPDASASRTANGSR